MLMFSVSKEGDLSLNLFVSRSTLPYPGTQERYEVIMQSTQMAAPTFMTYEAQNAPHILVILNLFFQVFIQDLVRNLFCEGNDVFNEGEWMRSIEMYTEALSIAEYADSEDISVPTGTLEKLYANRAAAYLNIVPVSQV